MEKDDLKTTLQSCTKHVFMAGLYLLCTHAVWSCAHDAV